MIHSLFPIPLGIYKIDIPDDLDENFFKSLNVSSKHGLVTDGESSHETSELGIDNLLDKTGFESIKDQIYHCLDEYAIQSGLKRLTITGSWFNIMKPGGMVLPHRHKSSTVSGALYIKSKENTCPLILKNPRDAMTMLEMPYADTPYTSEKAVIDSEKGRLIIFPSYIEHYTEVNKSNEDRIVISFNTLPFKPEPLQVD